MTDIDPKTAGPITAAALSALDAERAAREAQAQAERDALIAAAVATVEALPAPDGTTPLSGVGKNLVVEHLDPDVGLVVLSDGAVSVAVRSSDVVLVELVDGGWTERSKAVADLADLGEAIAGMR